MIEVSEYPVKSCSLRCTHGHQNRDAELSEVVRPRLSLSEFEPFSRSVASLTALRISRIILKCVQPRT